MTAPMMEEDGSHMTERILNLTLEIIYLLTGESFPLLKSGDHVTITVPPFDSLKLERPNMEKVLEATKKMMELLTGEGGIVNNSKIDVRQEIKEEDDECYMTEEESSSSRKPPETCPLPLDSTQEDHSFAHHDESENLGNCNLVVKEEHTEEDEEFGVMKEPSEGQKNIYKDVINPSNNRNPPERCPRPLDSRDCSQEDLTISLHDQGEDLMDIKVEVKSEVEEPYVRDDQQSTEEAGMMRTSIEEDTPTHISTVRGRDVGKISEHEDITQYSPGEDHQVHHSVDGPSHSSNPEEPQPGRAMLVPAPSHKCQESYTCPDCGECFVKKSDLHIYQNSARVKKSYSCSECGKSFSHKSALSLHHRIHTGEKPYQCSECGKRFALKHYLQAHHRSHTGEKLHPCSECGKCFSQKYHLNIHQRTHTGERPYPCLECGERFFQKRHLATHQRTHTGEKPYTCSECGKRFATKCSLSMHQKNHTGDKPHSCTECEKCYARKSELVVHLRSHTGEKPYACKECGKSYARLGNFHAHQRSHMRWKTFLAQEQETFLLEVSSNGTSETPHHT